MKNFITLLFVGIIFASFMLLFVRAADISECNRLQSQVGLRGIEIGDDMVSICKRYNVNL